MTQSFRLETERLLIRPWEPADLPDFIAMTQDPEIMRYVHGGVPYNPSEIGEWQSRQARQLAQHNLCMGALIEKASGRVVGVAGAQPMGKEIEIGWWLATAFWGRGYATEAGAAAKRHVLEVVGRDRVVAIIDPPNDASKRVAARLGMSYEGRFTGAELGHRKPEIVVDMYAAARP